MRMPKSIPTFCVAVKLVSGWRHRNAQDAVEKRGNIVACGVRLPPTPRDIECGVVALLALLVAEIYTKPEREVAYTPLG